MTPRASEHRTHRRFGQTGAFIALPAPCRSSWSSVLGDGLPRRDLADPTGQQSGDVMHRLWQCRSERIADLRLGAPIGETVSDGPSHPTAPVDAKSSGTGKALPVRNDAGRHRGVAVGLSPMRSIPPHPSLMRNLGRATRRWAPSRTGGGRVRTSKDGEGREGCGYSRRWRGYSRRWRGYSRRWRGYSRRWRGYSRTIV
jgi:hypothetical protein